MKYLSGLVLLLLCIQSKLSAGGIDFRPYTLEHALDQAKKQNKWVFIDTYALWCAPCKQMDQVFRQTDVGNAFNNDFISIKIDMDGEWGAQTAQQFGVIWLPTLIILDADGQLKSKVDRLLSPAELIDLARIAKSNTGTISSHLSPAPFSINTSTNQVTINQLPEPSEEVVYVYDERVSSARPSVMYHEAYLHVQLMDGKQDAVVQRYLSTQEDWSTDKNIRFIFDFLNHTRSPLFEYFKNNKPRFEEVIGAEKVRYSLEIMIYQQLENGFPRPSLEEAKSLFMLVNTSRAEEKAYHYYAKRMADENKIDAFTATAETYLTHINAYDPFMAQLYATIILDSKKEHEDTHKALKWMEQSSWVYDQDPWHYHLITELYLSLNNTESATINISKAYELLSQLEDKEKINIIIERYRQLTKGR